MAQGEEEALAKLIEKFPRSKGESAGTGVKEKKKKSAQDRALDLLDKKIKQQNS